MRRTQLFDRSKIKTKQKGLSLRGLLDQVVDVLWKVRAKPLALRIRKILLPVTKCTWATIDRKRKKIG